MYRVERVISYVNKSNIKLNEIVDFGNGINHFYDDVNTKKLGMLKIWQNWKNPDKSKGQKWMVEADEKLE